ncbi:GGDEF domain-containing protein [Saccharothrix tamanrassetensis]|uniref:GGDEF domain-containing protein n=1 Tax=Saccharothrix tamanrassetensis TaxID=1051531 RepID=A0A841CCZ6_9PSEU|nr:GGDEF domain-containing protein [Saccharothrix tamanrassetensis]MBB5955121.1 GGDEF domain-containing protein [Saccharothrix tamanrassetensis]
MSAGDVPYAEPQVEGGIRVGVREVAAGEAGNPAAARRPGAEQAVRGLRSRWRTATTAAGWPFPADWPSNEVDEVCAAVLDTADPAPALHRLGAARAEAGATLAETLLDLAALHAVMAEPPGSTGIVSPNIDATPAWMLRATALGWGEVMSEQAANCAADNPLTGLATGAYLRTRLREVYAEARTAGRQDHVLVLVALDLSRTSGWSRVVAMTLLADALREVFDAGQTIASIGPSVAAVLLRRDDRLHRAVTNLRLLTTHRLAVDPHVAPTGPAEVWLEELPATYEQAAELIADLGR